ncbi:MAG: hypothetical protein EOO55_03345 [Hymenobacter sp.]|nr:MAG: hypothetical protein EOO55_03345 [Hymenobacter sp.]
MYADATRLPEGWTIAPSGPAGTFVASAAREYGGPVAVASGLRTRANSLDLSPGCLLSGFCR